MRFWSALRSCAYAPSLYMRRLCWSAYAGVRGDGRKLCLYKGDIPVIVDWSPSSQDIYALDWEVKGGELRNIREAERP